MTKYILKSADGFKFTFELSSYNKDYIEIKPSNDLGDSWDFKYDKPSFIRDNGNGVEIKINNKKVKLDYCEFDDLYTLIELYKSLNNNVFTNTIKILDTINLKNVKEDNI